MNPFPPPVGPLGHLRILSPTAGVKVSPLALGGMGLGSKQEAIFGHGATREKAFEYLDLYREAGGNFIDTANMYQHGESEIIIGDWMEARQCRDEIVLATKFTYCFHPEASYTRGQGNWQGNNSKSLYTSFESSLKRLKTNYIDIFYCHFWDYTTSIPELMHSLHTLITSRKVLYLGISDTPAWIVSKANEYARQKGLTPFSVYQGHWSLLSRDIESDIIPMIRSEGMALTPYGVLGQGKFKTTVQFEQLEKDGKFRFGQGPTEFEKSISKVLEKIGQQLPGKPGPASVAQAWAMSKMPYVFPLIGGVNPEYLKANIEALKICLTSDQIAELEAVKPYTPPFPMSLFGADPAHTVGGLQVSPYAMMPGIEFVRSPPALGVPGGASSA